MCYVSFSTIFGVKLRQERKGHNEWLLYSFEEILKVSSWLLIHTDILSIFYYISFWILVYQSFGSIFGTAITIFAMKFGHLAPKSGNEEQYFSIILQFTSIQHFVQQENVRKLIIKLLFWVNTLDSYSITKFDQNQRFYFGKDTKSSTK